MTIDLKKSDDQKPARVLRIVAVLLVTVFLALGGSPLRAASDYTLLSPDGTIKIGITCTEEELSYSLAWNEQTLLEASPLSILPNPRYKVLSTATTSVDQKWKTVWGQSSEIRDHHEQLTVALDVSGVRVDLICRAFNDGVGFRFAVPEQTGIAKREVAFDVGYHTVSEFAAYASNGENEPAARCR